jgi:hypothetical protein
MYVVAIYGGFVTTRRVWLSHLTPFIVCGDGHGSTLFLGGVVIFLFFVCHAATSKFVSVVGLSVASLRGCRVLGLVR